jgi:hypothetical protein
LCHRNMLAFERGECSIEVAERNFAVFIYELHDLDVRVQGACSLEASVTRTRRRERNGHVEFDHLGSHGTGEPDAVVGRAGINVDEGGDSPSQRRETSAQAAPFVATDDHCSRQRALDFAG